METPHVTISPLPTWRLPMSLSLPSPRGDSPCHHLSPPHVEIPHVTISPLPTCSTAPNRRGGGGNTPDLQSAVPTMHGNPNFTRNAPGRSTYAYGTRRPAPAVMHHFSPGGPSSQPSPSHNSGFFKRLIPTRFSSRRCVCALNTCVCTCVHAYVCVVVVEGMWMTCVMGSVCEGIG